MTFLRKAEEVLGTGEVRLGGSSFAFRHSWRLHMLTELPTKRAIARDLKDNLRLEDKIVSLPILMLNVHDTVTAGA